MSGLSFAKLERQYLSDCYPERFERMVRKPDDFLKYAKGQRSPRSCEIDGSPLKWALERYPEVMETYCSFVFLSIRSNDEVSLQKLSSELYHSKPFVRKAMFAAWGGAVHVVGPGLAFWLPIGLCPRDAVGFRLRPELDALAALVIAVKVNEGGLAEEQCALLVVEWVRYWVENNDPPDHLLSRLVQVLAEHVPALHRVFYCTKPWHGRGIDVNHPCFQI